MALLIRMSCSYAILQFINNFLPDMQGETAKVEPRSREGQLHGYFLIACMGLICQVLLAHVKRYIDKVRTTKIEILNVCATSQMTSINNLN